MAAMQSSRRDVEFSSGGDICRAWHYRPPPDTEPSSERRACIVLAHGFAGTRDAGLEPYAERFAAAGFHVLLFDYRFFGASDGEPRQVLSIPGQLDDWAAAIRFARSLSGVAPNRIGLWGTSFSGGHVVVAAARDGEVAAVSAQGPMMDGLAAFAMGIRSQGILAVLRLAGHAVRDVVHRLAGSEPHCVPVVGPPGTVAMIASEDAVSGYAAIAPPDFRNEVAAAIVMRLPFYRPLRRASELPCPLLVLICERDSLVSPKAAQRCAVLAGKSAEVERYPIGHFDIYVGDDFERGVTRQIDFFRRHLAAE